MLLYSMFAVASASTSYPGELSIEADTPCEPSCLVCHSTPVGGLGTATQPFALSMASQGLRGGEDTESLISAFDLLAAAGTDSDDDGESDADALAAGVDPNTGESLCDTLTPVYGCLSHTRAAPMGWLAALALLMVRRRRS